MGSEQHTRAGDIVYYNSETERQIFLLVGLLASEYLSG